MSDYPDFTISAVLKGIYDEKPKALAVDLAGNIIAMLKAEYNNLPINLEADVHGNLSINLNAQGLSEIIQRNKYGTPIIDISNKNMPDGTNEVFSVSGKGYVYGCIFRTSDSDVNVGDTIWVYIDDQKVVGDTWSSLHLYNMYDLPGFAVCLKQYDTITPNLCAYLINGFSFESKFQVKYTNVIGVNDVLVGCRTVYALISGG